MDQGLIAHVDGSDHYTHREYRFVKMQITCNDLERYFKDMKDRVPTKLFMFATKWME